eukprot:TRINITY_DN6195_c0_g1_i1.p1 TRINITY_DN6195_c0_g1~~TRINITY_DN6195_c0_g1_i1.p1  ORF type:complete len:185 (-),score=58.69 TRINITY_DN6195_c0_g1_i1:17-571(-)
MGGPGIVEGIEYDEFDNFLHSPFVIRSIEFSSPENYFQCVKCTEEEEFEMVRKSGSGYDCWMMGSGVQLRDDWEIVKVREMYHGNRAKFEQNENLKRVLLSTNGNIEFRASAHFWRLWNSRILMLVREELREEKDRNQSIIEDIWNQMREYEEEMKYRTRNDPKSDKKPFWNPSPSLPSSSTPS